MEGDIVYPDTKVRRVSCVTRNEMDEAQYALPKDMYRCTFFDTEEEAEAYRVESGSHTNYHFSEKANKFYISEPNLLTEAILDSIDKAIDFLNVKVYLGMEYEIGRCWRDCH